MRSRRSKPPEQRSNRSAWAYVRVPPQVALEADQYTADGTAASRADAQARPYRSHKVANLLNASITAGAKLFPPPCPASSRTCSRQVVHRCDNRQAVINGELTSKRPWMSTPGIPFNF